MTRSLARLALLGSVAFAAIACGPPDETPSIFFEVTFDGQGCLNAGVDDVRVRFENNVVPPFTESCTGGSFENVIVDDLPPGTYRVSFEGLDGAGNVAYAGHGEFRHTVEGSHIHRVNLTPTTEVLVSFTFAGEGTQAGLTCAQAQIDHLTISVNGLVYEDVACSAQGRDAAILEGIDGGRQTFKVDAFNANGVKLYAADFTVDVVEGASNEVILNVLPLAKGGLSFDWEFASEGNRDCSANGVAQISYSLVDARGDVVDSRTVGCNQRPVVFKHDLAGSALDAGLYVLTVIEAKAANGAILFEGESLTLYAPAGRTQDFVVTLPRS